MTVKQYGDPRCDIFGKGPQTSMCINSNTSGNLDSTGFATVCLDFDTVCRLQVKLNGQCTIKYSTL
jgi:hypothetical protein